jgi:hypothetical protein
MDNENKMETIKKIGDLLKSFNSTFDLEAHIDEDDDELVASGLKIKKLKSNGYEFVGDLYETFNAIIKSVSEEHELIYDETRGLVIAKKIVRQVTKTDFVIEEF